jgi:hypothetical protein
MDDFTIYGYAYDEALTNLERVLQRCEDMNISLHHEKCFMMMNDIIVIGHHVSTTSIKVDCTKTLVNQDMPTPTK